MTTVRTVPRQVPVFMAVVALDSSEGSKTATLTLDSINIHWITMTLGQCRLSHRGGSNCRTRRCKHRCRSNWCSRGAWSKYAVGRRPRTQMHLGHLYNDVVCTLSRNVRQCRGLPVSKRRGGRALDNGAMVPDVRRKTSTE